MALLSSKIVEEILEVAEAYAARERARLSSLAPVQQAAPARRGRRAAARVAEA